MEVTVKQIQRLDRIAIEHFGIPSLVLMENAGRCVAQETLKLLKRQRRVCIVCGLGNNAGDGFVAARHLINHGCRVDVILIGDGKKLKSDAAVNYALLRKTRVPVFQARKVSKRVIGSLKSATVTVDAIFGVGLNRRIGEPYKAFIEAINRHARKVVAVDTPSGLDATSGKIFGACVKADKTVTFTLLKKGFNKNHGPAFTGNIVIVDIGIPKALYKYCQ